MKRIDILWLIEHVAREMEVAIIAKYFLEKKYNFSVEIRHIYLHAENNMHTIYPRIVLLPFFYKAKDLAVEEYLNLWKDAIFINLAWEQMFYKAHKLIKAPQDKWAREKVIHHAWGKSFKQYLIDHGVKKRNIFFNSNPIYELYSNPLKRIYKTRKDLARIYKIPLNKKWIFFPENYRWAFLSPTKKQKFASEGLSTKNIKSLSAFCNSSLYEVLHWFLDRKKSNYIFILRPRPATTKQQFMNIINKIAGKIPSDVFIIKNESVRNWVLASDVVVSSYSTTLLEASVGEKPSFILEPKPIHPLLRYSWFKFIKSIKAKRELDSIIGSNPNSKNKSLQKWIEKEYFTNPTPIKNLCNYIGKLSRKNTQTINPFLFLRARTLSYLLRIRNSLSKKQYFNYETHENDIFNVSDITEISQKWKPILKMYV